MNPALLLVLIIAASVLFLAAIIIFVGGYITYRMAFYNDPKKNVSDPYRHVKDDGKESSLLSKKLIDNILTIPYEDVYTTSHDGLKLRARLYMKDESAPFALQFHGYKSTPMLDFSGGGVLAMQLGFNVIMPDQRACGKSEGKTISFGYNEHKDVFSWIEYVREKYGTDRKIMLFGVSLGAGTVIMAAGKGCKENVVGAMADCPYSSAKEIITKVIYDKNLPGKLLYPLVRLGARLYGRFDPNLANPYLDAENLKIPVLLIHGEDDDFVPVEMSRKIAASGTLAELHTFPGAKHGTSYVTDVKRYYDLAEEFSNRCFESAITSQNDNQY